MKHRNNPLQTIQLPLQALGILLSNRSIFLLAFLPGIVTLALTLISLISMWQIWLMEVSKWISYPVTFIAFPILWIIFGNLALLPVEDLIIDKVQLAVWKTIRLPSPKLQLNRVTRELFNSLAISVFFLVLLLISFIPGLAIFSYIVAAWISAFSFLSVIYARKNPYFQEKLRAFFRYPLGNTLLGIFLNILLFIPIFNVWLLGYALILSTLLEIQRDQKSC